MLTKRICPECGYTFSWYERAIFTKWVRRQIVACPHCKTRLSLRQWSFLLYQITGLPIAIAILYLLYNSPPTKSYYIVILVLLQTVNYMTQKIERYKE